MRRLLVPVRDDQTIDAIEREIRACEPADRLHVVVLSVQPKPVEWQTRGLFREVIRSHLVERGHRACRPIEERLTASGIQYHTRVELGEECAEILRCAEEERCDGILLEADHLGWVRRCLLQTTGWVAGSIAGRLIHSSNLPVTVVH
jgi:nucleotide-binding universal stress UspA family protein